jgi:hypothetical protein
MRQPQDDIFVFQSLKTFLLSRLKRSQCPDWLKMVMQERALIHTQNHPGLIPATSIQLYMDIVFLEKNHQNWRSIAGVIWKAMERFHLCMQERIPPNISLEISLYSQEEENQNLLMVWS